MGPELGRKGRAGMAVACAAACGFPMLIAVGALSIGTATVGGSTAAAVAAIAMVVYLVLRGQTPAISERMTRAWFAAGGALAAAGLMLAARDGGRPAATLVVVGIAALTCLALMRLAVARPLERS